MEKFGKVCKEYMIKKMTKCFKGHPDFFVTAFSKVNVEKTEKFRKTLKTDSTIYTVVKNSLAKRAIEESGKDLNIDVEKAKSLITGSCGVLFSKDDPSCVARSLVDFSKEGEDIRIQGGFVNGEIISVDVIKRLAALPSREVLL